MVRVTLHHGHILVRAPFSPVNLSRCRLLPDGWWDSGIKAWRVPASTLAAQRVRDLFGDDIEADEEFRRMLPVRSASRIEHVAHDIPHARTKPWRHQREAYWFVEKHKDALLHMGMGTGKSKVTVDVVCGKTPPFHSVILCPKSVIPVWPGQFEIHAGEKVHLAIPNPRHSIKKRVDHLEQQLSLHKNERVVCVLNYEAAWQREMGEWLLSRHWNGTYLDESHRIKTHNSRVSKFCARLRDRSDQRLCLTGTPMSNNPLDIWAQFRFLNPRIFSPSYVRFRSRYAVMGGHQVNGRPVQVIGFQNQEELAELIGQITYQALSEDVLDLPETTHVTRCFDLDPEERRVYRPLQHEMIAEVCEGVITAANALAKMIRLAQVTSGFGVTEDGNVVELGTSKRKLLEEVLEDVGNEPVVIFCRFHHDLDTVADCARRVGRDPRELSGRRNELDGYRWADGNGDTMCVQLQAGGLGVDFTRARYAIYWSVDYNLGNYQQSLARLHRPGQTRPVTNVHLVANDTVDILVNAALEKKENVVRYVLSLL